MADANKRIDLAAPLLSVRRHGGAGAGDTGMPNCEPDDAVPGGVPFGWERRPGHPKSVRTRRAPPLRVAHGEAVVVAVSSLPVPEEAQRFSDGLSRVDSCFTVNCSVTGLSDAGAPPSAPGSVMMDRFLPAAKAVSVGSSHPQCTFRKPGAAAAAGASTQDIRNSLPRRLPVEHSPADHVPSDYAKDTNDDDEWDVHSTAGFASKRCGLLPTRCVKSTLLLLNPAPAMRRGHGRFLSKAGRVQREMTPLLRQSRHGQPLQHDANMSQKSWEEVYINSLLRSDRGGLKGRGALASELDRTVRELYTNKGGGVHPKATNLGLLLVLDRGDEYYNYHFPPAQTFPEAGEAASPLPPKTKSPLPANAEANGGKKLRPDAGKGFPPLLEEKTTAASRDTVPWARPLLTLPPPKSPTESWLSRALPSVSNKPRATSFLGIHVQQHPRRQTPPPWCSSGDQAKVVDHARPRQIRIHDLHK